MFVLVYGLERKIPIDSTGHYSINNLPSGTLSFRIVSQDLAFPFDMSDVTLTQGEIDTVPFTGWRYHATIGLNTSASGAAVAGMVTGFPALIRLTKDDFNFASAQATGADLRFGRQGGSFFPYEIERFDPAAGFQGVWHMNENPSAGANAIKDRTANGHNGTPVGTMSGGEI